MVYPLLGNMLYISLAGEKIAHVGVFPITNSLLTTWLVMIFLLIVGMIYYTKRNDNLSTFRIAVESVLVPLFTMFESIVGSKTRRFFPLLATLFIFIIFSNWSGLLPGVGSSIGIYEPADTYTAVEAKLIPLFRASTADLNTTIGLAIIAVAALQYYGISYVGPKLYIGKFLNFKNPIYFFVGILELISEFSRLISFSFRLFGNIFAGEVLLAVIAFLIPVVAPLPFLGLELFVGFIQALVFSMLTAVFLNMATVSHEEH